MTDDYFKRHYQGQWELDPIFECFVEAWMTYHRAADSVDGDMPIWDRSLTRLAVRAGNSAIEKYFKDRNKLPPSFYDDKEVWNDYRRANVEALRRVKNERRHKITRSALFR